MSIKRIVALVISLAVLAFGIYQIVVLQQYNTQAQGTITSFYTVDTNSILLGNTFSEKSAQANIYFQAKNGKAYNFTIYDSKPGGVDTKLSIAPNNHVSVRYDSAHPQNAVAVSDLQKELLTAYLITGFGGLLMVLCLILPWLIKRNQTRRPVRPPRH